MKTSPAATRELAAPPPPPPTQRIFYGWIVLGLAFTVLFFAYGIQFTFGVFMPAIEADTGWDRASLSLPYALYVFLYSALGAASGWATDRWGPRVVILSGGCLLGGGILLTSQVRELWQLYVSLGLIAAMGMSAAFVPCNSTVVRWFTRRRGLALSISTSGGSMGNFLFPPLAAALIGAYGWRSAYLILGSVGLAVIGLCAVFIVRDPQQLNLQPDGAPPAPAQEEPPPHTASGAGYTLAEARGTLSFWLLNLVFTLTWLVVFMPFIHLVPFAIDLGVPQVGAATVMSVMGLGSLGGRLLSGAISDRLGRLPTLGVSLALQVLAFVGFMLSSDLRLLYPSALIFGLAYGGAATLFPAIVGDFFGLISVGAIVGFIFAVAGSTAAFGPYIAGYMYDASGSYETAFLLGAGLNLLGLGALFFVRKPPAKGVVSAPAAFAYGR